MVDVPVMKCSLCDRDVIAGLREQRNALDITYGPEDKGEEAGWRRVDKTIKESKWNPFSIPIAYITKVHSPKNAIVYGGTCRVCHKIICVLCINEYLNSSVFHFARDRTNKNNAIVHFVLLNSDGTLYGCPHCHAHGHTVDAL